MAIAMFAIHYTYLNLLDIRFFLEAKHVSNHRNQWLPFWVRLGFEFVFCSIVEPSGGTGVWCLGVGVLGYWGVGVLMLGCYICRVSWLICVISIGCYGCCVIFIGCYGWCVISIGFHCWRVMVGVFWLGWNAWGVTVEALLWLGCFCWR